MGISGCIITLNEADNVSGAITNLQSFCDEVVVIDGDSQDNTVKISKDLGAKVYVNKWDDDFSKQRNFGISKATQKWVFMLDTDERVTPDLSIKLKKLIHEKCQYGFMIPRVNYIDGKTVRSDSKYEMQPRLFRDTLEYIGVIHEKPAHADKFCQEKFADSEYIIHDKSAKNQKKHLLYQKGIIVSELERAKREKDRAGEERAEKLLKKWEIWWNDTKKNSK